MHNIETPPKIVIRFEGMQALDPLPLECVAACSGQGDATESVQHWCGRLDIQADPELVRSYLRGFGAWEAEELADESANMERLVWTWACNVAEERKELGLSLDEEEDEENEAETWADLIYLGN